MTQDQSYWANVMFLALVVWREARGVSYTAKLAVAYSVLQRVASPGWWGSSTMSVIFHPLQYSSMTAEGDPNLTQWPVEQSQAWLDCVDAAVASISRTAPNPAPRATSYYANYIDAPAWAAQSEFIIEIDTLRFYNVRV